MIREGSSGPVVIESQDVTVDVASLATQTAVDTAITVTNARVGDTVICTPLGTWPVGVVIGPCRCLVAGTVQMRVGNVTVGAVDPVSQVIRVVLIHEVPGVD